MEKLGKNMKYYRIQAGYSQKELAELLHLGERTIGHYETGTRIPPIDKLELIADALDVELEDLRDRHKKDMDDWEDYFFFGGKGSKKNMDERRFKMIIKRVYYAKKEDFEEEGDVIEVENYVYSKSLANDILALTNKCMNVHECWYCPPMGWIIQGYILEHPFEITIRKKEDRVGEWILKVSDPFDENYRLSQEIKQIVNIMIFWFHTHYPDDKLDYSLKAKLYKSGITNENLLSHEIEEYDFENRIVNGLVKHGCNTIQKMLSMTEQELRNIVSFGHSSQLTVEYMQKKIKRWLTDKTYYVFAIPKPTLRERYPNAEDIPVGKTELDLRIVYALLRDGIRTLGDICQRKRIHLFVLPGIDEEELEEIEEVLATFSLSLYE